MRQYPLNGQDVLQVLENTQKKCLESIMSGSMDLVVYNQLLQYFKNEENMKNLLNNET